MSKLLEKWKPLLEHEELPKITDQHRLAITAQLLENQQQANIQQNIALSDEPLNESADVTQTNAPVSKYDTILMGMARRTMPNLIAYDMVGVQAMTAPSQLIFAMRPKYADNADLTAATEAFYNESDSGNSGTGTQAGSDPSLLNDAVPGTYTAGTGMATAAAEQLGTDSGDAWAEMGFEIDKFNVEAKSRALKAHYSVELAQDMKNVHGLNAESELASILSTQMVSEINREIVRTMYVVAKEGSQQTELANAGEFDMDADSNGRWFAEKFSGLKFQIEREMNVIARETRRGKGNILLCTSDVAAALNMSGSLVLDPSMALSVDDTGNTFVGMMGTTKVYIDPYATGNWFVAGYKGSSAYDSGIYYCPYIPLTMYKATGEDSFQPRIGFKTRYALASNPFAHGLSKGNGALTANSNVYYRRTKILNLQG